MWADLITVRSTTGRLRFRINALAELSVELLYRTLDRRDARPLFYRSIVPRLQLPRRPIPAHVFGRDSIAMMVVGAASSDVR